MSEQEKKLKYKFPAGFLLGVATSSHQIEGGNENDWTAWELAWKGRPGGPADLSGRACNSWELYERDIEMAGELHCKLYRFSIEWSRVEPREGHFDKTALRRYHQMARVCKKRGIEPLVKLHHFTNPQWFAARGGWRGKHAPDLFRRYAARVAKEMGNDVKLWCTINEPLIYTYNSFWKGKWPPQKKSYFAFRRALKNLSLAHKKAYETLHDANPAARVSIAKNNQFFESYLDTWLNKQAVKIIRYFWNRSFLNSIRGAMDYIGLNYYFHNVVRFSGHGYALMNKNKQTSDLGWEIYPRGLYQTLKELQTYQLPVYILENGLADADDSRRANFIRVHLREAHRAIADGVDVRGYCHWSLLDNFEWAEGFAPKFGLYAVDFKTFKRVPRPSAGVYAEICKNNGF